MSEEEEEIDCVFADLPSVTLSLSVSGEKEEEELEDDDDRRFDSATGATVAAE